MPALASVRPRYVRTFMPIAVQTGKCEVPKYSEPTMLTCNDVIDVKRQWENGRRKMALFTAVIRAMPDLPENI